MNSSFFFKTNNQNYYLFNKVHKQLLYCHPTLFKIIQSTKLGKPFNSELDQSKEFDLFSDNLEYYVAKSKLYEEKNLIGSKTENKIGKLTKEIVMDQVANLNQLTFEVTDNCNLKCKYCGYGDLYDNYDDRIQQNVTSNLGIKLINHLIPLWESLRNRSSIRVISIGFYGGEPLLNISFIKDIVNHVNSLKLHSTRFSFNMTTNGMLLKKNIDFLAENNFQLLISLDGNELNNSYRVDKSDRPVFHKIYRDLLWIKQNYLIYFHDNIQFNSVLHSKNSISEIYNFIYKEFGKIPRIGELNPSGVRNDKIELFSKLYKNKSEDIYQSEDYATLENKIFLGLPGPKNLYVFLNQHCDNVYQSYNHFFTKKSQFKLPTGTCLPFGKKMFITVLGKILACERIGHHFVLGKVSTDKVELDFDKIADLYNSYYRNIEDQCMTCYNFETCFQCIFQLDNLNKNPICEQHLKYQKFRKHMSNLVTYMENSPQMLHKITLEAPVL